MLVPISSNHSISRVIANFILAQSFVKPKFIYDKLITNDELTSYQKKGLTSAKTINIQNNSLNISPDSVNGFLFEEFDEVGKSLNVLKIENTNNNKAVITFENKKYPNWTNYRNRFISDIIALSKTFDVYIEAIGLTYVDEFVWKSTNKIDVNSVFNESSDLINKKFLSSYNGTLISVSQSESVDEFNFLEEKTEIIFNNELKRIIVNHTYALKLREIAILSKENSKDFEEYFNRAHKANKDILSDIFTNEVKDLIKLK
ncbi:TIGR04255 family protein [Pedobacter sp. SD-b]|uniref:TIGR04255 family protein n=1 Tax=Pedobacter segetis TaxID=2793069 RepID=A0ABS1BGP5_9SPHI|nr:TIGR04255 family protein [Pedobacter segetis]MBK0382042.1 TIGR04255 family protein [Pedobacter segetis]